jgi:C4-dicarboxylate-specific signal transduction histidine kinase
VARAANDHGFFPATAAKAGGGLESFICVPVQTEGRLLGTLSLGTQAAKPFEEREVALLEATAAHLAVALENARLQLEARRQLEELERARAQLLRVNKLTAVGDLAGAAAHEINNPLTTILGQAHLLLMRPDLPQPVRERLQIIADEAARVARIVQNLLLFARQYPSERRPASLADQAQRVLDLKGYQLQRDGVQIVTEWGDCPPVWADENQLQQVLLALVQNAHQAMAGQRGERVLRMRTGRSEAGARLEVLDTGPRWEPDALSRVFDPLATVGPGRGGGPALAVAVRIVTDHGGRLQAANGPEGGAIFTLELPLAPARPA